MTTRNTTLYTIMGLMGLMMVCGCSDSDDAPVQKAQEDTDNLKPKEGTFG